MKFVSRSIQSELLDQPGIPFGDIRRNMQELEVVNRYLGGHAITIAGLRKLMKAKPRKKHWHIAEIGCGGGDNLAAIGKWCRRHGIHAELTGIDINAECISYARGMHGETISFIHSDYRDTVFHNKPDIIFSSLFTHHFSDNEIPGMLHWMRAHTLEGFFINDLHRHPMAYYAILILTQAFSGSYLVKHDAPLSVGRSFVANDWKKYFREAGIEKYICLWKWAFRWLVIYSHE